MTDRLEVCISIDTEFGLGGSLEDPTKRPVAEPQALCEIDGKGHGVDFLLDTFHQYEIDATFFVECANYYYFGNEPMRSIVKKIQNAGQDPQLHVHPCWLYFNEDPNIGKFSTDDNCKGRSFDELKQIFSLCIEIFESWAGKKPVAIRTGNLSVDRNVYKVMSALNIPLASNVGLDVFKPEEGELQLYTGRTKIDNVMEIPVFTYQDKDIMGRVPTKSLQITSCSWPEMKCILEKARKKGIEQIVVLTHPFEFVKTRDSRYSELNVNRLNQERLQKLCAYIKEHDQDFTSGSFGNRVETWRKTEIKNHTNFKIPPHHRLLRKFDNFINDRFWNY